MAIVAALHLPLTHFIPASSEAEALFPGRRRDPTIRARALRLRPITSVAQVKLTVRPPVSWPRPHQTSQQRQQRQHNHHTISRRSGGSQPRRRLDSTVFRGSSSLCCVWWLNLVNLANVEKTLRTARALVVVVAAAAAARRNCTATLIAVQNI